MKKFTPAEWVAHGAILNLTPAIMNMTDEQILEMAEVFLEWSNYLITGEMPQWMKETEAFYFPENGTIN